MLTLILILGSNLEVFRMSALFIKNINQKFKKTKRTYCGIPVSVTSIYNLYVVILYWLLSYFECTCLTLEWLSVVFAPLYEYIVQYYVYLLKWKTRSHLQMTPKFGPMFKIIYTKCSFWVLQPYLKNFVRKFITADYGLKTCFELQMTSKTYFPP